MKVLHLAPYFQPEYAGGMQRYVAELCREQLAAGTDASVLTLRQGTTDRHDRELTCGVPVEGRKALLIWQRTPFHPMFPMDLRSLDADVIHLHSPSPSIEASLLLARPRKSKLVVTLHNVIPRSTALQGALAFPASLALRRVLQRADAIIAPHRRFAEHALGSLDVEERLHVIAPGVDHASFRDLGLERDQREVLFVGHVRPEKGLHVLVEAMKSLSYLHLRVMASVSYETAYFRSVRAEAEAALGDRVRFELSPSQEDLSQAYNRAACVVAPSLDLESWNLVMLEAAATGAACVCTDLPGLAWANFAARASAGDAAALADAIATAIDNQEEAGQRAARAADEYSWQRTCRETLSVYAAATA